MATQKRGGAKKPPTSSARETSALRQFVMDQVAETVAEKTAEQTRKVGRKLEGHLERHVGHLTANEQADALDVWTRPEPRARRPRFSRESIAAAAVHIADTEGIDALSMRRLAAELGAGTMTLYHYVRTKDELLTLLMDAVMGEVVIPGNRLPADWRAAITAIARSTRNTLRRHGWMLDIADDPAIGPNSVRHFDQSLRAVDSLDVSLAEKFDVIIAVDEYVFGTCLHERGGFQTDDDPASTSMNDYLADLIASGEFPTLGRLIDERGIDEFWAALQTHAADESRFDRNLTRLLDGIEADLLHRRTRRR